MTVIKLSVCLSICIVYIVYLFRAAKNDILEDGDNVLSLSIKDISILTSQYASILTMRNNFTLKDSQCLH